MGLEIIVSIELKWVFCCISLRQCVGIGGSLLWNNSYALRTITVPSSCVMFIYKLVTSIDTKMTSWPIFVFYKIYKISSILYNVGLLFLCNRLEQSIYKWGNLGCLSSPSSGKTVYGRQNVQDGYSQYDCYFLLAFPNRRFPNHDYCGHTRIHILT